MAKSEDELQTAANELNRVAKKYDLKISSPKTKTIGSCIRNVQRAKIEIVGKIIE
jgi:hypothetical protein